MAKTDAEQILEFIVGQGTDDVEAKAISENLQKSLVLANAVLSPMVASELLERTQPGRYKITNKGRARIGLPPENAIAGPQKPEIDPTEPMREAAAPETSTAAPALPSEYDKFIEIGRNLGLKDSFNKMIADTVFAGDSHDLKWVWQQLNSMYLRPDVTKRWFNVWTTVINQQPPPEIAKQTIPSNTAAGQNAIETAPPQKWTIVGSDILPDPEGEYTWAQARQMLMAKSIAAANPGLGADKVSDIINAITPLLSNNGPSSEQQSNQAILTMLLEHTLKGGDNGQKPMSATELIELIKTVSELQAKPAANAGGEKKSALQELMDSLSVLERFKSLFSPANPAPNQNTANQLPIPIADKEGKVVGAVPLDTLFMIQDHNRKVEHENEEFSSKQETAKTIRKFLGSLANAAQNFAERE